MNPTNHCFCTRFAGPSGEFQLQGVVPRMTTPAEFEAFLNLERVRHQVLIKRANIPMED